MHYVLFNDSTADYCLWVLITRSIYLILSQTKLSLLNFKVKCFVCLLAIKLLYICE